MKESNVSKKDGNQVIHLTKEMAFPKNVRVVEMIKLGNARLITPAGGGWASWFDGLKVSDDFMKQREQPKEQKREAL